MPNDNVEIGFDLKLNDINMSAANAGSLMKGVKQFTAVFQKALDKVSKTTVARSISALFGKDTSSDIVTNIQKNQEFIEELKQEYLELKDAAEQAERAMRFEQGKGPSNLAWAKTKLQEMADEAISLPKELKKAQQMYASNKGAMVRAKDPNKKLMAEYRANQWKATRDSLKERIAYNATPEAKASASAFKKYLEDIIANNGINKGEMASLQKNKDYATAGMESNKEVIADINKEIKAQQKRLLVISKFINIGTAISKIFDKNADKDNPVTGKGAKKSQKAVSKWGKSGYKATRKFGDGFRRLTKNILTFGLGFRTAYYAIKSLRKLVVEDLRIIAREFSEINDPISNLLTKFNQLKGAVGTMVQPIISAIIPALQQMVQWLSAAAERVGTFFAVLTGQDYIYKAKANQADFASGTNKLADYDELKTIDNDSGIEYEKVEASADKLSESSTNLLLAFRNIVYTVQDIFSTIKESFGGILPMLSDLLADVGPTIMDTIKAVIEPLSELLKPVFDVITKSVKLVAPLLQSAVENILPPVKDLVNNVLTNLGRILESVEPIFQVFVNKIFPFIWELLSAILPLIGSILDLVIDLLGPITELLAPLMEIVMEILNPILAALKPILSAIRTIISAVGKLVGQVLKAITPGLQIISDVLEPVSVLITEIFDLVFGNMADVLNSIIGWIADFSVNFNGIFIDMWDGISGWFSKVSDKAAYLIQNFGAYMDEFADQTAYTCENLWGNIKSIFKSAEPYISDFGKNVKDTFEDVGDGILEVFKSVGKFFKDIINGCIYVFETMINGIIKGLNFMVNGLNKISIDIPDWVPKLGGKTLGFDIPSIPTVSIPRLAQGAVIPPNSEFLAMLGDQRSGTNIEAPLETIKQALIEAISELGGMKEPVVLQLNGKEVARAVWDEETKRYKQTGKFAYSH